MRPGQKGTGLWTVVSALEMGVPVPTIYAALNARVLSSLRGERMAAESVLSGPAPHSFSLGEPATGMVPLRDACILACIASYGQGMALLQEASKLHDYHLDFSAIGQIWKGGCIIRARLLQRIQDAYAADPSLPNLMLDPWFAAQVNQRARRPAAGGGRGRPGGHSRALPQQHPGLHRQLPHRPSAPESGAGHARLLRLPYLRAHGSSWRVPHRMAHLTDSTTRYHLIVAASPEDLARQAAEQMASGIDLALAAAGPGPDRPGRWRDSQSGLRPTGQ